MLKKRLTASPSFPYSSKVAALDRQRQHGYDPEWVAQEAERLLHEWQAGD